MIKLGRYAKDALLFARRHPGYNYAVFNKNTTQALVRLEKLGMIELDKTSKQFRFRILDKGKEYAYKYL